MGFISWIVLGLIAGALAKLLMPGKDGGGFIITTLLGIGGAMVGGYIGSFLGYGATSGLSIASILTATAGAFLLLFAYRLIKQPNKENETETPE
ncbi:MAG: GlsB/YeaQ/YmgE family stress response membrane protein [Candidatus Thiodiazotropha sp. (ex Codakia rugifera)]|nr:GlsB/YeaQ/YmgE family stress response membrane protein [Candidatus Thiodiazotropha sp. (ex Codakia rugifera)]